MGNSNRVNLNEELIKDVQVDLDTSYNQIELAIYLYIKLAELFIIDNSVKCDDISDITFIDNTISNDTFKKIYIELLKLHDISYTNKDDIRIEHGEYAMSISFDNISIDDISNIKPDCKLEVSNHKLRELITKVYTTYFEKIIKKEKLLKDLKTYKNEYSNYEVSKRDKIFTLLKLITSKRLTGKDAISYIQDIFNKVYENDSHVNLDIISENYNNKTRPVVVVSIFDEDKKYHYILIDNNSDEVVRIITQEELIDLINLKDMSKDSQTLSGLEDEEDARGIKIESSRTTDERRKEI